MISKEEFEKLEKRVKDLERAMVTLLSQKANELYIKTGVAKQIIANNGKTKNE